ncbi:MAG: beta-N-acetylglucosaminidase domain-containing protein [Clostridia bacterium]|nr:beta-N-acetylglucosaminidase domain-containing protein [Clostridia bacterium]
MIYPVPRKNNLNGSAVAVNAVTVNGEYKDLAEKILSDCGINIHGGFNVEIKLADAQSDDEKYFITVTEQGATVEAFCRRGVFRAVNTLAKLITRGELKTGTLEDYPLFARRGYIEGFYGHTWKTENRLSVMKLMARYGMNSFYYAPKDDEFHRAKWRELYPEKEMNELKMLFDAATENELDFCWCIGPGLTYKYTSSADFDTLINKIKSVYSLGVRNFGLLLDDIPNNFQYEEDAAEYDDIVSAHIALINNTYNTLKAFDSSIELTVCPTQYFGKGNEHYITRFGQGIPSAVNIFWTGREICSGFLTTREADDFALATSHRPLYWDNYPVNDAEMFQEMHLGALRNRDADLYRHSEGLIANVMEYAECSKIPLITIADYLWNPEAYDSEKSLENAQTAILGEKSELFKYIADHLCVSCVSRYGSQLMSDKLSHLSFLMATGQKEQAVVGFKEYNAKMRECLAMIQDTSVPLFAEIGKWTKKFAMCCDVLDAICAVWEEPSLYNKQTLRELMDAYNSDAVILTGFCLREAAEKALD